MPCVVLRYRGPSDELLQALSELDEHFECTWAPGDPDRARKTLMDDFGFNLCLVSDHDLSRAEAVAEGIEQLEEIAAELAATGHSLHGCVMDVGLSISPNVFSMSTKVTAEQCAKLAALGVDLEFTFYPPYDPKP